MALAFLHFALIYFFLLTSNISSSLASHHVLDLKEYNCIRQTISDCCGKCMHVMVIMVILQYTDMLIAGANWTNEKQKMNKKSPI